MTARKLNKVYNEISKYIYILKYIRYNLNKYLDDTILSGGSLGSWVDEERGQPRE